VDCWLLVLLFILCSLFAFSLQIRVEHATSVGQENQYQNLADNTQNYECESKFNQLGLVSKTAQSLLESELQRSLSALLVLDELKHYYEGVTVLSES
jgi:hypothetical protein